MYSEHYLQDTSHACPNDVVLLQSPMSHCMLPFANLQLYAEHKLKGGGVPSPEGLHNENKRCDDGGGDDDDGDDE